MTQACTIALDAMGGDGAPEIVIHGADLALAAAPYLKFRIFGDEAKLSPLLASLAKLQAAAEVIHTDQAVGAEEKPSTALRQGTRSSMRLAINDVHEGRSQAVVSAGNTGALMAMSKVVFKTLPGVSRPAIAGMIPSEKREVVLLDMGANLMCDAQNLFEFAVMGEAFCRAVLGYDHPRIGLLNVGSEDMKGHEYLRETAELLRGSFLAQQFAGFVEGTDIARGTVDVVVTDGFTGNIVLKTAEGIAGLFTSEVRRAFTRHWAGKLCAPLARLALGRMRLRLDPARRNGGMLVGLNGVAVKSHGGASAVGFAHAIQVAADIIAFHLNERITEELRTRAYANGVKADAEENVLSGTGS